MKKIVIVEDEFRTRQGLGHLINKVDLGCRVIGEAENGYEGLKMIRDLEPDIVITDIRMPKMDGLEMIEKVQAMGIECVFAILSGYADFEYARQGLRLGVKEYLLKPATISDVKELLRKLSEEGKEREEDGQTAEYSPAVKEMVSVIEENYGMRLGLDGFSDRFRLTPEYLSNLFAKETGMTFSNYLKKVRIEKAKELILNTDMKIYEVAYSVGYPDQKYFSKVFKEYTGVSAKQYAMDKNNN
ncbi:MAG: response regulator [Lachnospiraceae bacterium]|jgi:Response regulator containing CheY-like receiver domain and AraC-type DNA-binding domain|nr:response regulator [Lachnospiraceae bacterium]